MESGLRVMKGVGVGGDYKNKELKSDEMMRLKN